RMSWASQATAALQCLHERGIYHGDITPSNIFVDADLSLKLADFDGATFDSQHGTVSAG
ncbi:hypothetical protein CALVIDRAFT_463110, partial [Calocera viscosa TUFC12733]